MVEFSFWVLRVFIYNKSERNYRGISASVGLLLATAVHELTKFQHFFRDSVFHYFKCILQMFRN